MLLSEPAPDCQRNEPGLQETRHDEMDSPILTEEEFLELRPRTQSVLSQTPSYNQEPQEAREATDTEAGDFEAEGFVAAEVEDFRAARTTEITFARVDSTKKSNGTGNRTPMGIIIEDQEGEDLDGGSENDENWTHDTRLRVWAQNAEESTPTTRSPK